MEIKYSIEELFTIIKSSSKKNELFNALSELEKYDEIPFDQRLVELLNDNRWLIRQSAIKLLAKTRNPDVEFHLLKLASETKDYFDLIYINSALYKVGSKESIHYLTKVLNHKKEDVVNSALSALNKLGSLEQMPIFLECLKTRGWAIKQYAMVAIVNHGDHKVIPVLINRVKQIIKRRRKLKVLPKSELLLALEFLLLYHKENKEIKKIFLETIPQKKENLFENEIEWYHNAVRELKKN